MSTTLPPVTRAQRVQSVLSAPWLVALGGCVVLWGVLLVVGSGNGLGLIASNGRIAAFVAIAALGQMLVITTGRGAIDLSIPYTITLTDYVVTILQRGDNSQIPIAVVVALAVGLVVGLVNALFVVVLRVPAIVATLAVGFGTDSVVNLLSNLPGRGQASSALAAFVSSAPLGVPTVAIIALVLAAVVGGFLWRTGLGLRLISAGQNDRTAAVSGLRPERSRVLAFALSGLFAAVVGILLCGYSNGAFLGIGTDYLLSSIAAVVLGGTLMAGGMSTVTGCVFGALFLTFIVTLTNTVHLSEGLRSLVEGLIIIVALAIRSQPRSTT